MYNLRTLRRAKGLTQMDLSDLIGVSQSALAEVETGKRLPRKTTRRKIERILGNEIDWISTLSRDKGHIGYALKELINLQEPGAEERIKFSRQYLTALEK
jgi:transcriptional regulator with XRE-family HTH domain